MALSEYSKLLLGAYAEQPFLMAPMAGVTDPAYRIMCRRRGAHLAYSEMVSVAGLAYASNKTWRLVLPADEEQQICVQLFGSKPDQFASAVAAVEERVGDRLSLIDINMACPARKVVTKGEGSALMRTPDLAEQIVEAAVGAAHVPVTVKIRKGFYAEDRNAATFAQMLEGAGAAAVAVHGRWARPIGRSSMRWPAPSRFPLSVRAMCSRQRTLLSICKARVPARCLSRAASTAIHGCSAMPEPLHSMARRFLLAPRLSAWMPCAST